MPKLYRPRELPKQRRDLSAQSWEALKASDQALLDRDHIRNSTLASLRSTIQVVPRAERGVDWVERVVSIYAVLGLKGRRCSALIANIERARNAAGEPEKFEAFKSRLRDQMATSDVKTPFSMTFEFSDHDQAMGHLKLLFSRLAEEGYESFVNSGTLLGAIRDQDFIAHDYDADLAVVLSGDTNEEVIESFNGLFDAMHKHYGKNLRPRLECKRPVIKVKTDGGLVIDLFPLWLRDGKVFVWPHTYGELTKDDVLPLTDCVIKGETFPAPKQSEKMLVLNYGEGWGTPDSTFEFPWEEAKVKFSDFLTAYERDTKRKFLARFMFWKS